MSLARGRVRERGTWKVFAVCAMFGVTAAPPVTAAPGSVAPADAPRSAVVHKASTKKPSRNQKSDKRTVKDAPRTVPEMIRHEFGDHADEALRVAHCESKLDPLAHNAGAVGVFQILASAHDWRAAKVGSSRDLTDARTNISVARHLFEEQGWAPWTCARIVGIGS